MIAPMRMTRLDRVQLAMPAGGEDLACAFYDGALGIPATQEPANLAQRCSGWCERGELKIHLGVELDFRRSVQGALRAAAHRPVRLHRKAKSTRLRSQARQRLHRVDGGDPFGNRIELIEPVCPQGERAQTPLRAQALANTRRPLAANSMIGVE